MKNLNLIVMCVVAVLALLTGSMFRGCEGDIDVSAFKHKYDSINQLINTKEKMLQVTAQERDSAREAASQLQFKFDSIERQITVREKKHLAEMRAARAKFMQMNVADLSGEAKRVYKEAHPAPLFDDLDTLGARDIVPVERNPLVYLLEQNLRTKHLQIYSSDLKAQIDLELKQNSNLRFQVSKYQADSTAYQAISEAKDVALQTKDDEMKTERKQQKKELRRQRWQKVAITAVAVGEAVLLVAIIL
jgi:hypothetical protein